MRQRVQISLLLVLSFLATGAQWDLIQVFAWGRMTLAHAESMSLSQAASTTFDGEMCAICRMVANAKQHERSQSTLPETKLERKVLLFFQATPQVLVEAPSLLTWRPTEAAVVTTRRSAPPVPPPRADLA